MKPRMRVDVKKNYYKLNKYKTQKESQSTYGIVKLKSSTIYFNLKVCSCFQLIFSLGQKKQRAVIIQSFYLSCKHKAKRNNISEKD